MVKELPKIWKKKSHEEIKNRVFTALKENVNYTEAHILGIPASFLDDKIFNQDALFLSEAPFISTLIQNPNHIGCHTLGRSESFFKGTQEIEKELIEICAVDILKAEEGQTDGYVASGGTEANMQALWIYRNYFMHEFNAKLNDIVILCSEDCHYSMDKGANILMLDLQKVEVTDDTREITKESVSKAVNQAKEKGKKFFIVISNMMTTMFGSVDNVELYSEVLKSQELPFKIHVDGAYGGFYFPFAHPDNKLSFSNPNVSSVTLDAHKMAQAPYGTGIFLVRKSLIQYSNTREATYVEGEDFTMIGSRSGANAVATWMILVKTGPFGWKEKVSVLQQRTDWICAELERLNIDYYRNPNSNIVTIRSSFVPEEVARKYGLVPDNHSSPKWFKIVVMDHVTIEKVIPLLEELESELIQLNDGK